MTAARQTTGDHSASSIRRTTAQRTMGDDVTLSCWFCRLKGAEYSFFPKSSGNLFVAAKKGQTEDLGTVQSFDVDRTIVLCSVSPCDLGMYEPEWVTDILPPDT